LPQARERRIGRQAWRLAGAALLMFAFGYALAPLYDVFCEWTGAGGRAFADSSRAVAAPDLSRSIAVEFDTNLGPGAPLEFKAAQRRMQVHPGQPAQAEFTVRNLTREPMTARAVYNMVPAAGAQYVAKTECFCFTEQPLAPGETKRMPMRFVVDPALPQKMDVLTLSYTFYASPQKTARAGAAPSTTLQ
jgi:cytochrome c oxidase assembly protein subunit 11